jgi:hypothetical protein
MNCKQRIKALEDQLETIDRQITALLPFQSDPSVNAALGQLRADRHAVAVDLANERANCAEEMPVAAAAMSPAQTRKLESALAQFEKHKDAQKKAALRNAKLTLAKSKAVTKALRESRPELG